MNTTGPSVIIDNQLLDEYTIVSTLISPLNKSNGLLVMGDNYSEGSDDVVLRFFLLVEESEKYRVHHEIQSFYFADYNKAEFFLSNIGSMNALDLLLVMGMSQYNHDNL